MQFVSVLPFVLITVAFVIGCDHSSEKPSQNAAMPSKVDAKKAESRPATDWSQYPKSRAFESFKSHHEKHQRLPDFGESLILITWFRSENIGLEYVVDTNGKKWDCRVVHDWAAQDSHDGLIEEKQLEELSTVVRSLPESGVTPPLERLVMVTRRRNDAWRTDAYDADQLPDSLEKVFSIIGERFETRDRVRKKASSSRVSRIAIESA